ncbi:TonB-dependent receptor [Sandarakinorhabdus sp. AAP62]|uniref:TonB-dependent receptor plug domain-containing protein n=1 Tax=Sandarakinorhabdus sp. AAP62 TaxID=1248916 RepID=UPI00030C0DD1|nr:TonB-dependent receptor [Sandarakinorhabdus sp. AAP62]
MTPSLLALLLAQTSPVAAQTVTGEAALQPSLPAEALITVTAPALPGRVLTPVVGLSGGALLDRQPRSVGDALRGLPGVSVRTNSRGETIARVRGSDERQTLVFLDGAPLAVPWDGRVDIGLLPAGLIGGLSVRKGAGAIEYGANAVAGVLDLTTRASGGVGVAQAGPYGMTNLSAAGVLPLGGVSLTLAAAHQAQSALPVAQLAALPFNQPDPDRRLNTDLAATSLFGGLGGTAGSLIWRVSLLTIDARRGIAPESDRSPAQARFWRTPEWSLTQAQIALELPLGTATARAVLWRQWFGQQIEAYRDASYTMLRAREFNDDDTLGGRFTLSHGLGPATLRWSLSGQTSDHRQTDIAIAPNTLPSTQAAALLYRQTLASGGVEADVPLGGTRLTLGLGLDRATTPRTGDKPAQPSRQAATFSVALALQPAERLSLTLSGGRRNRFASARELFGEAQGRFLANPALLPERAWLADAELGWRTKGFTLTLTPFWQRVDGSIGQRIISVNGNNLRQRFNQAAATSIGLDAALQVPLAAGLTLELTGSALDTSSAGQPLLQRPAHEAMLALDWARRGAFDFRAEMRRIGPARDLAPDGRQARLAPATEINLRARIPVLRLGKLPISATAAIDNLTNAVILPQQGLPQPGRSLRIGLIVGG